MKYDLFKKKLLEAGLDKERFLSLTKTPKGTYEGWASKRNFKTPYWVQAYLDLYIENRNNEIYISKLKEELNKS
jgi:hypothetical protein